MLGIDGGGCPDKTEDKRERIRRKGKWTNLMRLEDKQNRKHYEFGEERKIRETG